MKKQDKNINFLKFCQILSNILVLHLKRPHISQNSPTWYTYISYSWIPICIPYANNRLVFANVPTVPKFIDHPWIFDHIEKQILRGRIIIFGGLFRIPTITCIPKVQSSQNIWNTENLNLFLKSSILLCQNYLFTTK